MTENLNMTREDAVDLGIAIVLISLIFFEGKELQSVGVIDHVCSEHQFKDEEYFYRFCFYYPFETVDIIRFFPDGKKYIYSDKEAIKVKMSKKNKSTSFLPHKSQIVNRTH